MKFTLANKKSFKFYSDTVASRFQQWLRNPDLGDATWTGREYRLDMTGDSIRFTIHGTDALYFNHKQLILYAGEVCPDGQITPRRRECLNALLAVLEEDLLVPNTRIWVDRENGMTYVRMLDWNAPFHMDYYDEGECSIVLNPDPKMEPSDRVLIR